MRIVYYFLKGNIIKQKIKFLSLLALPIFSACGSEDSDSRAKSHYFNEPYFCVTERTSEKTGKVYKTGWFYHPEKNWVLQLSAFERKSFVKVANLHTSDGRYDGKYKGIYPDVKKLSFSSLWTNKNPEPGVTVLNGLNKAEKSDCSLLNGGSAIFDSIDLNNIMFIDGVDQEK